MKWEVDQHHKRTSSQSMVWKLDFIHRGTYYFVLKSYIKQNVWQCIQEINSGNSHLSPQLPQVNSQIKSSKLRFFLSVNNLVGEPQDNLANLHCTSVLNAMRHCVSNVI